MKYQKDATTEARQFLLSILKPGDTLNTILRHVSRSGMSRNISVLYGDRDITHYVAIVLEMPRANDGGIKIGGCGTDMGFEIVYSLSRKLFHGTFECVGEDREKRIFCPSNDHFNGDRNYKPHIHSDGGYAIRQRWL